ncbi:MAG: redoxin domain-containing protein [Bacteroidota bacterium]
MRIKKNIRNLFLIFIALAFTKVNAQKLTVYKIDDLLKRIHNNSDTTYVVNFWATWCKPCVAELPEFEKLNLANHPKVKVILVSMDFKEELDKKLKNFLDKNKYTCEVVLLDEINGNDFINKISEKWSGAIPATLIVKPKPKDSELYEGKLSFEMLSKMICEK